eukprot:3582401-Rhodomonas_salina.1
MRLPGTEPACGVSAYARATQCPVLSNHTGTSLRVPSAEPSTEPAYGDTRAPWHPLYDPRGGDSYWRIDQMLLVRYLPTLSAYARPTRSPVLTYQKKPLARRGALLSGSRPKMA